MTAPDLDRKFWAALALFAVLAALVWFTMGEGKVLVFGKPVELRLVPLIVIGGLALRTVLARHAEKIRSGRGRAVAVARVERCDCLQDVLGSLGFSGLM